MKDTPAIAEQIETVAQALLAYAIKFTTTMVLELHKARNPGPVSSGLKYLI